MKPTFELTEIFATYKCTVCGTADYKGQKTATFFPAHYVKECMNPKCPSKAMEEPKEDLEENAD